MIRTLTIGLLLLLAAPALGQDAAPRGSDGHVLLGSGPGVKGYWELRPGGGGNTFPRPADVPFQPWARAVYEARVANFEIDSPAISCKAAGGPEFFSFPGFDVVAAPELDRIFILNIAGPHTWRVVYMDGRDHPDDVRPTFLGHSVGRWEGDTLVIDTVGFNEKIWFRDAYPSTNQLHIVERLSRPNMNSFIYEVTVDDPGAYTAPWSGGWRVDENTSSSWIDGGEMFEFICQDSRE